MVAFNPIRLFGRLPGISEKLARRITEELDVHTLEELELAAHDGRLKKLKGFGRQRVQAVKEGLAGRGSAGPGSSETIEEAGDAEILCTLPVGFHEPAAHYAPRD